MRHLPLQVQCVMCGVGQERETGGQDCFVQLLTLPLAKLVSETLKCRHECMGAARISCSPWALPHLFHRSVRGCVVSSLWPVTAGPIRKPLLVALRAGDIQDSFSPSVSGVGLQTQTWKMNCSGCGVPWWVWGYTVDPAAQCSFLRSWSRGLSWPQCFLAIYHLPVLVDLAFHKWHSGALGWGASEGGGPAWSSNVHGPFWK